MWVKGWQPAKVLEFDKEASRTKFAKLPQGAWVCRICLAFCMFWQDGFPRWISVMDFAICGWKFPRDAHHCHRHHHKAIFVFHEQWCFYWKWDRHWCWSQWEAWQTEGRMKPGFPNREWQTSANFCRISSRCKFLATYLASPGYFWSQAFFVKSVRLCKTSHDIISFSILWKLARNMDGILWKGWKIYTVYLFDRKKCVMMRMVRNVMLKSVKLAKQRERLRIIWSSGQGWRLPTACCLQSTALVALYCATSL